jgi:TonB family protein
VTAGPLDTNADQGQNASGYEILTKTLKGDPGSYADRILQAVREKWYPLIPKSTESSNKDRGATVIEFVVRREGTLGRMRMVESSGNKSLDAFAWNGIKSVASFAPMPPDFHLKSLRLRFHFGYNQATADRPTCNRLGPDVYFVGREIKAPHAVNSPDPEYSEEARKTKYQGSATLRTTVGTDGLPSDVCVVRALGSGLDEKAVSAVKTWKFEPATKDGTPVPVAINVEVSFHLY